MEFQKLKKESSRFNVSRLSFRDDGSSKNSTGAASSATEELDVLMASLSTFKVGHAVLIITCIAS